MRKFSKIFESTKEEDKQLIEDIFASIGDSEYISSIKVDNFTSSSHKISIWFSDNCIEKRKVKAGNSYNIVFSLEEMNDYWKDILDAMNTLKNYGFNCIISTYMPNSREMVIRVNRNNIS